MGQGNAVALTAEGLPFVSYFGFAAKVAEGAIADPAAVRLAERAGRHALHVVVRRPVAARRGRDEGGLRGLDPGGRDRALRPGGHAQPGPDREERERHRGDGRRAGRRLRRVDIVEHGELRNVLAREHRDGGHGVSPWAARSPRPVRSDGRVSRSTPPAPHGSRSRSRRARATRYTSPTCRAASGPTRWWPRSRAATGAHRRSPPGSGSSAAPRRSCMRMCLRSRSSRSHRSGTTWTPTTVAAGVSGYGLSFAAAATGDAAIAAYYTGNGAGGRGHVREGRVDDGQGG